MLNGKQIRDHFRQLTDVLVGFDEYLVQAMLAMLTKEHVLWISTPGAGKSYAARLIFSLFTGRKFCIQMTKDMLPSHLVGNEIPDEYMKSGKEIYNLDGGIADVEFFFGDEFEDASDFLLRMLNTILNERRFERKDVQVDVPLHTAILTTNFDRTSVAIDAVKDRIIFKSNIPPIQGVVREMEMFRRYLQYAGEMPKLASFPYEDLRAIAAHVDSPTGIVIPRGVQLISSILIRTYWDTYKTQCEKEGRSVPDSISPRTKNKLMDVLRASAFLNDRTEVDYQDCLMLKYALCVLGDDRLDEQIFTQAVGVVLPKSKSAKERIDKLAAISQTIQELSKPPRNFTQIVLRLGKKVQTYTQIEFEQLMQSLRSECAGVEKDIVAELEQSFKQLSAKPDVITFDWGKDWKSE